MLFNIYVHALVQKHVCIFLAMDLNAINGHLIVTFELPTCHDRNGEQAKRHGGVEREGLHGTPTDQHNCPSDKCLVVFQKKNDNVVT